MGRHLKKKDFSTIYFFSMFNFGRPLNKGEKNQERKIKYSQVN